MNSKIRLPVLVSMLFCFVSYTGQATPFKTALPDSGGTVNLWAFDILHIIQQKAKPGTVITVAVVDDGFQLSHKALKNFIYTNNKEIPGNFQDDDGNGYVDDIHGWDISDNDDDVSVPKGKEDFFYHGTYVTGIITSVFQKCYGSDADKILKIIPVKVLSDYSKSSYLADGYKGLKYACDIGADIICCAWSGGSISEDEKIAVNKALARGTIIIASAGNFSNEKAELPSSLPGVFCVAALDSTLTKSKTSNFGMRIDIAGPGQDVYGAFPAADNSFIFENGTSPAAAIIAGCTAILKALKPEASSSEIMDAITNTATPVDSVNMTYCGKLGAGLPDMTKAMQFLTHPDSRYTSFQPSRPEGKLFYSKNRSPKKWEIHPFGTYKGIHIFSASVAFKGKVNIYKHDSLWYSGPIGELARGEFIPGNSFKIELQSKPRLPKLLEFSYYMETIDSTTLYCSGIKSIDDENGIITDNSGDDNYANNSSCKWQLSAPPGKRIRIEFEYLDTQPNVDFVWIFDGNAALQENIIAKFSGQKLPPVITSLTNQVLIWFITDDHTVAKGWKMKYHFVD